MGLREVVACDIDGVLADWHRTILPLLIDHLGVGVAYEDLVWPDLADCFGIRPVEMKQAIEAVRPAFGPIELPPLDGALEAVRALMAAYDLVIITSRHDAIVPETYRWVEKYLGLDVPVHFAQSAGYIYGGGDGRRTKLEIARQEGAICLVEDNWKEFVPEFVDWPHDEIMAICYAQPWNRNVRDIDPRIYRLEWPGIRKLLLSRQHFHAPTA